MNDINGKRVLAGGGVALLVLLVFEGLNEAVFAGDYQDMLQRLGLADPGEAAMGLIALGGLLVGVSAVWLYAIARSHYGAGPRTALRIAASVWVLTCLVPNISLFTYGILSSRLFWIASGVDLAAVHLATLAGAWVYRERSDRGTVASTTAAGARLTAQ